MAPAGGAKKTADNEANAKALPVTIGGHQVYGVKIAPGIGYRNNKAMGTATGDNPETIYMVASGDYYNAGCCFDYGNAETNSMDNGEGTMEAVYFGNCTIWNKGAGEGPWVMADLENGLWAGDVSPYEKNTPVSYKYVTGMVKGDATSTTYPSGHWTIKVGNAQSGGLTTPFDGPRPNARYNPMRKEGAIVLGTGRRQQQCRAGELLRRAHDRALRVDRGRRRRPGQHRRRRLREVRPVSTSLLAETERPLSMTRRPRLLPGRCQLRAQVGSAMSARAAGRPARTGRWTRGGYYASMAKQDSGTERGPTCCT